MKELDIKVGYSCNNRCVFCLNKDKRSFRQYPITILKNNIANVSKKGCQKLIISGGEPLISKYFFEIVEFAKEKGIKRIEVQTNARMLYYENLVKRLEQFRPIGFLVSFHFPNVMLYKKYCLADGFDQVVSGIKNLIKYNLSFTINTVIMKPNLPYLEKMLLFLKKLGVKRVQYRFIDGKNVIDSYKEFVPKISSSAKTIGQIIERNPDISIGLNEFPFCVVEEKYRKNIVLGDPKRLNLTTKKELLNSQKVWENTFIHPNCKNCKYLTSCRGVRKEYYQFYGKKEFNPIIK